MECGLDYDLILVLLWYNSTGMLGPNSALIYLGSTPTEVIGLDSELSYSDINKNYSSLKLLLQWLNNLTYVMSLTCPWEYCEI